MSKSERYPSSERPPLHDLEVIVPGGVPTLHGDDDAPYIPPNSFVKSRPSIMPPAAVLPEKRKLTDQFRRAGKSFSRLVRRTLVPFTRPKERPSRPEQTPPLRRFVEDMENLSTQTALRVNMTLENVQTWIDERCLAKTEADRQFWAKVAGHPLYHSANVLASAASLASTIAKPKTALALRTASHVFFVMSNIPEARVHGAHKVLTPQQLVPNLLQPMMSAGELVEGHERARAVAAHFEQSAGVAQLHRLTDSVQAMLPRTPVSREATEMKRSFGVVTTWLSTLYLALSGDHPEHFASAVAGMDYVALLAEVALIERMASFALNRIAQKPLQKMKAAQDTILESAEEPKTRKKIERHFSNPSLIDGLTSMAREGAHGIDAIIRAPDFTEQYQLGLLKPGRKRRTVLTTDLIGCSDWMSRQTDPDAAEALLNREYFPRLTNLLQFGENWEDVLAREEDPAKAASFVNSMGDAILLCADEGGEEQLVQNSIAALWNTRRILNGTRFAIHSDVIDLVIRDFGPETKQPNISGDPVNMLFRCINLNNHYGTSLLVSREVYDRLGPELQNQFFFVDAVTPKDGKKKISLYSYRMLRNQDPQAKQNVITIPDEYVKPIKDYTETFRHAYLAGDFQSAMGVLNRMQEVPNLKAYTPWVPNLLEYLTHVDQPHEMWNELGRLYNKK